MNLVQETATAARWVWSLLVKFHSIARGTTVALIASAVISKTARMMAFLLPLKIILLAGADGVPSYFRLFMSPEQKSFGIVVLSLAAILFYALSLLLDSKSKALADHGGTKLLNASRVMALVSNQRTQAQGFFVRVTQIAANLLFAALGAAALVALSPLLVCALLVQIVCLYLFTVYALRASKPLRQTGLSHFIKSRLSNYLSVLSSVVFLTTFLVILSLILSGANDNILIAIISIVLLRQILTSLTGAIREVAFLVTQKRLINALVFPDHQLQIEESKNMRNLRDLLDRRTREKSLIDSWSELRTEPVEIETAWIDPAIRGTAEFNINVSRRDENARELRQRVFPPHFKRILENEDLLFLHVSRERVGGVPVAHRFSQGDHECIVYDTGPCKIPSVAQWRAKHQEFLVNLWSLTPPAALVEIYSSSHKLLCDRLSDQLVPRMSVAVSNAQEEAELDRFSEALPAIRKRIAKLPLCLNNPDATRPNAIELPDGSLRVFAWGKWTMDVVGARLTPRMIMSADLLLDQIRAQRPELPGDLTVDELRLVAECAALEHDVNRGLYRAALKKLRTVLNLVDKTSEIRPALASGTKRVA